MSLVIKNYYKDFSEEELSKISAEELQKFHHKAWMKDGLECMKRKKFIKVYDENRCPDGILVSTIIESYGDQYPEIAKAVLEKEYKALYPLDAFKEALEEKWFDEVASFAAATRDCASLDNCFEMIKQDYLKGHQP